MFVCVDPKEEAIPSLVKHYSIVIESILDGSWKHYALKRHARGVSNFMYDLKNLEAKMTLELKPHCFLLQPCLLRQRLSHLRLKIASAFRSFDYSLYSPLLCEQFGDEITNDQGSGIEELFPTKPPGRPKKIRLEVRHPDQSSNPVSTVLFQATDLETKKQFVFIRWQNPSDEEYGWVPLDSLSPVTSDWWNMEKERCFPFFNFVADIPALRVTSLPVTIVFDYTS